LRSLVSAKDGQKAAYLLVLCRITQRWLLGGEAQDLVFWGELGDRVVGAPSILAADFANLAEDVRRAEEGGAELVHFDAMDNHFVPNLTIGPVVAASLVEAVDLPVDAHLMVDNPDNLIQPFIEWALPYLDYVLVMRVNPGFGGQTFIPEMVDKVRRVKEMTDLPVQVDGGITAETAPLMVEAGAQVLVAGSAVYKGDPVSEMRKIIEAGRSVL
jgi:ribulose-phosphate 3-epimerase